MILSERMRRYEAVNKTLLPLHSYVVVRVDGRAFHTYTKKLNKPFDKDFMDAMDATTIALCREMQNAVFGYVQSDEISILMYDRDVETQPWFGNEVQKIVALSASIATKTFNNKRLRQICENITHADATRELIALKSAIYDKKEAEFYSRVFVLPNIDEVVNYILWRYRDWNRNSINTVGQTYLSQKELLKKTTNEVQEMLFQQKGINWNNYTSREKRGGLCMKTENGWQMIEMPHVVCNPSNEFYTKLINSLNK